MHWMTFEFEERRGDDLVVKEAIGVAGLVTPWNFPMKPNFS
jgi:aldehyde dehydrogenase (NAD+)